MVGTCEVPMQPMILAMRVPDDEGSDGMPPCTYPLHRGDAAAQMVLYDYARVNSNFGIHKKQIIY